MECPRQGSLRLTNMLGGKDEKPVRVSTICGHSRPERLRESEL